MEYKNLYIFDPDEGGDGLKVFGDDNPNTVEDCRISFKGCDIKKLDENISFINGCMCTVKNCTFENGIKLALCGNGDYPNNDKFGKIIFENCTFKNFGRRGIEAQDGITVILKNCTISNWGVKEFFDVRSFATWAHSRAKVKLYECHFEQTSFFQSGFINFFIDLANHIGNDINDHCLSLKSFIPGVCKGAYSTDDGTVYCYNCTKNKWWIYLE